jgi:2-polyprenyl-6-hydroxyphenyl methylase / 3-demethylubiquinone-9 3-methyltransferase
MTDKSSIDTSELNKFNKTMEEWWDKKGEFHTLHEINPVRIEYISHKIKEHFQINTTSDKPFSNLDLIDIGSGGGLVCVPMHKLGANVTGLDANQSNTQAGNEYAQRHNLTINYINSTVEEHIKSQKQYDIVLCLEVIEHVANPELFIRNLSKLLKPGGMIIMSTINRTAKSYLLAIVMAEYVLGWVPKKTHDHSKFLKPSEISRILGESKLTLKELKGLSFNLLSSSWHLSEDIDVNYFAYIV